MATGFVGRRDDGKKVWLYQSKSEVVAERVRDVRWGDFLNIRVQSADGWTEIAWGVAILFIRSSAIVQERPLEIVFVDVGQGDGCFMVSPETGTDERILVVDAGEAGNMLALLKWRFGKLKTRFRFHAAVITHPDMDHYQGFADIFRHENIEFERVYHNGLAERAGGELLGASDASGDFLIDLVQTSAQMRAVYADGSPNLGKKYGKLMRSALDNGRVDAIEMVSTAHGQAAQGRTWLPGFAPGSGRAASIEILGPVPEQTADGAPGLRWFGSRIGSNGHDEGKTKNGHSVLLRVQIGHMNVLLGGDLNRPAEDYLLRHYSGIAASAPLAEAVAAAGTRLGADVLKCCHHGAADVTDEFLQAVDPFAFVISSGDENSHAHPRPELLGRLGKFGRGAAPLILCTELLRSTRARGVTADFENLRALDRLIDDPDTAGTDRLEAQRQRSELQDRIQRRNVGVFGAITLRSDGEFAQITFMLEQPRGKQRWHTYGLRRGTDGEWQVDSTDH